MADNTPLYNLKAVINETGLNPVTLRAWERRYGLLKPKRSPGGHRLYTRQDIEMLKWLIDRQREGLSISSAIEMWKTQPVQYLGGRQNIHSPVPEFVTGESVLEEFRDQWLSACMVFDDQVANQVLDRAFSMAAPETILGEVILKGLSMIGEQWYSGSTSVQQEHFASALALRRVYTLLAAVAPPTRPGHILAACPPGEEHDFILLVVTYLLRRRGWDVVYLGSNVPLIDLDKTIHSISPILIISTAQSLKAAASLRIMSEFIISQGIPFAYGGRIFNDVPTSTQYISGYFLGYDFANVPQIVERLATAPPPMPTGLPVSQQLIKTLKQFIQNEGAIATHVSSIFRSIPIDLAQLDNTNAYLGQFIASALTLGDITLLDNSILWLNGFLLANGCTSSWVRQYFATYRLEVEHYLGDHGLIIQDELKKCELSS